MSRPKQNIKRDRQLNLSLTQAEQERVKWRALSAGMAVPDYGRWRLLGARLAKRRQETQAPRVERLVYLQLKCLGNNLNQLVRRLHATGEPAPPHLDTLLKDIRTVLNRGLRDDS